MNQSYLQPTASPIKRLTRTHMFTSYIIRGIDMHIARGDSSKSYRSTAQALHEKHVYPPWNCHSTKDWAGKVEGDLCYLCTLYYTTTTGILHVLVNFYSSRTN